MKARYLKLKYALLASALWVVTPFPASAVTTPTDLKSFAVLVVKILQNVAGLLFFSLSVGLLYGVILYLANSDNEQKRESLKGYLLWGVIGIVVVMGIWGILALLRSSLFGAGTVGIPQIRPPQP